MNQALLIVNADDFGLTPGVNRGIIHGFENGIITSTSLLAVAPAFDDAVACWRATSRAGLGIGVHFALVGEDPPLLSAREIPSLVDARGHFPPSWKQFLPRASAGRIDPDEVRAELGAQLRRIEEVGIVPTHVDSHQHLHLWPMVRRIVVDLACQHGIDAIRVPRSMARGARPFLLNRLADRLGTAAHAAGLRHPQVFAGLEESGSLDQVRLKAVLQALGPFASAEIGCHPGLDDDPDRDRYRWGFHWSEELLALCDPTIAEHIERHGFVLGSFADL